MQLSLERGNFIITYYGYGTTPLIHKLPIGTSIEEAMKIGEEWKADPHKGFVKMVFQIKVM